MSSGRWFWLSGWPFDRKRGVSAAYGRRCRRLTLGIEIWEYFGHPWLDIFLTPRMKLETWWNREKLKIESFLRKQESRCFKPLWIPAFAGMTINGHSGLFTLPSNLKTRIKFHDIHHIFIKFLIRSNWPILRPEAALTPDTPGPDLTLYESGR